MRYWPVKEPITPGLAQLLYEEVGITTEALPKSAVGQTAAAE